MVEDMLKRGIAQISVSSYCSPAFLVDKPDKNKRLVINYTVLNTRIASIAPSIPRMVTFNHLVNGKTIFSKKNLKDFFII